MKYKIISVESRKGGVGKTTAALNLSKLLLDKGYTVLLIDIDITGTNVIDALDSSYWKGKINPILYKGQNANLLKIYQDVFMRGLKLPRWKLSGTFEKKVDFEISSVDINILGSVIYDKDSKNASNLICNPSILFDELHAFWFVEYLQTICNSFAEKVATDKTVIILDNSPGFIGINPAIHEWLTDLGPINGKFLTISSLDKQDLVSCSKAIDNLHYLLQNKYEGAKFYSETIRNKVKKEFNLSGIAKSFYLKIASDNLSDDSRSYYSPQNIVKTKFPEDPHYYQAIIVNKVPAELQDHSILYNFSAIRKQIGDGENLDKLLGNSISDFGYMVYYDEYINLQFIESSLSRNRDKNKRPNLSVLKRLFSSIERIILNNKGKRNYYDSLMNSENNFSVVEKKIGLYQHQLDRLIEKLEISHLRNIVKLIEKVWYPRAPFDILRQDLNEFISDYSYPNFDVEDEYESDKRMQINFEKFIRLIEKNINNTGPLSDLLSRSIYFPSFKAVVYITISPYLGDSHIIEMLLRLVTFILKFQLNRLSLLQRNENDDFPIRKFLIDETVGENKIDIDSMEFEHTFRESNDQDKFQESFAIDFYLSFCKAQVRLIDLDEDFDFLVSVIRQITVDSDNKQEILYPYIKDVLDNVILKKSIPHSRARKELHKGFKSANYMSEFQNTLQRIINNWEEKQ